MSLIFDTHAHYDDQAFDEDRKELLSGLLEKGIGNVLNASAALRNMPFILRLTEEYGFMYAAAGLHPCETYASGDNKGKPLLKNAQGSGFSKELLSRFPEGEIITEDYVAKEREYLMIREMLEREKVVAVGEIGLDYHYDDTRKEVQKEWFEKQIALAKEKDLPVIVHSRDAAKDTLDLLKAQEPLDKGGIIHCFSYGKEMAGPFLDMGFYIGIGGVVTFKNARKIKEVVCYAPIERLVLETDCPYLAPSPFRGKRNDSSMLAYVAETIGQLKGIRTEEVIRITTENANRVYRIFA